MFVYNFGFKARESKEVEDAVPLEVAGDGDGGGSASTHPGGMQRPLTRNEWPCAALRPICDAQITISSSVPVAVVFLCPSLPLFVVRHSTRLYRRFDNLCFTHSLP